VAGGGGGIVRSAPWRGGGGGRVTSAPGLGGGLSKNCPGLGGDARGWSTGPAPHSNCTGEVHQTGCMWGWMYWQFTGGLEALCGGTGCIRS
jgi:hypothetical protein